MSSLRNIFTALSSKHHEEARSCKKFNTWLTALVNTKPYQEEVDVLVVKYKFHSTLFMILKPLFNFSINKIKLKTLVKEGANWKSKYKYSQSDLQQDFKIRLVVIFAQFHNTHPCWCYNF